VQPPSSAEPLRGALVGYGLAGRFFHAPLISSTPGLGLATVVTSNAERTEQARAEHPGTAIVPTADDLFAAAGDHDFVVIATANDAHVPLARAAIDAGLPVVVDKPLAPDAEQARELVERAESAAVPLTVFHNRRWDSDQLTLDRLRDEGRVGEVLRYESRFERWRPELKPGNVWREVQPPEAGGGVLLDIGTHLIDQALRHFGRVASVYAEIANRRGGAADDDVFVALTHRGGVISHLWASTLAAAPGPRLRVLGDRAAFVVDGLDGQEAALRAGARPAHGDWGHEPPENWGRLLVGEKEEPVTSEPGDWPAFYAELERALRDAGPMPVDPLEAVAGLEVVDAARRSAAAGSPMSL
jgi:predicted dehydrogenase